MSQPPPGYKAPPSHAAPADADATRGEHVRTIIRGSAIWYGIAAGLIAALAAAYFSSSAIILLIGAAIVVAGAVAIVFVIADNRAEQDFFRAFAADHGFSYRPKGNMPPLTPLLSAGDRRHSENHMEGPLSADLPGMRCALAHYTFETVSTDSDGNRHWEPHHFTACMTEVASAMGMFPGVYLTEHRGMLGRFDAENWLRGRSLKEATLESSDFSKRYKLLIDPSQSELALRELFSPSFIVWCTSHPLRPYFEFRAGTLVVYVEGQLEQAGKLQWLLEATRDIARRVGEEAGEGTVASRSGLGS